MTSLFQNISIDDLAEKSQKVIRIHEIDPDAMQQLVNYAYTGDMMITEDNVQASISHLFYPLHITLLYEIEATDKNKIGVQFMENESTYKTSKRKTIQAKRGTSTFFLSYERIKILKTM